MPAHRFALGSVQTLSELIEFPLFLDCQGVLSDAIEQKCRVPKSKFTGSLSMGDADTMTEVWLTANPDPVLMQAKYKRVF